LGGAAVDVVGAAVEGADVIGAGGAVAVAVLPFVSAAWALPRILPISDPKMLIVRSSRSAATWRGSS
jgi:hypothetical protein